MSDTQHNDSVGLSQRLCEVLAGSSEPVTVDDIAGQLGVDSSDPASPAQVQSMLGDLETKGVVRSDGESRWSLTAPAPMRIGPTTIVGLDAGVIGGVRFVAPSADSIAEPPAVNINLPRSSRMFYELSFRAQFAEKQGMEFQRFFESIMEAKHGSNFRKVKPSGQAGDEKNDGFLAREGTYFQVYAPSPSSKASVPKKMDDDFEGAVAQWPVKTWIFLHNDSAGLSPALNKKILELDSRYPGIDAIAWSKEDLRRVLFSMDEPDISAVLGMLAPSPMTMSQVGMHDIGLVVNHVASSPDNPLAPVEPVPSDKAKRNRLSPAVEDLLQIGMTRMKLVEEYFKTDPSPDLGSKAASTLHQEYERLRDLGYEPDDTFQELWRYVGGDVRQRTTAHESAVLAVLAYFFWTCDIFENVETSGDVAR